MKKLAWLTDIHLDFLNLGDIEKFAHKAAESEPDAYLLGGDISVAPVLHMHLRILEHYWGRPIYFVLGNHDYYKGSINKIRNDFPAFLSEHPNLRWLPHEGVVELSPTSALIGHGLWADGRLGLREKSSIMLNDYALIEELEYSDHKRLFQNLNKLGDRAVAEFEPIVRTAVAKYSHIYCLTHVPPFEQAAWHNHHVSDPQFLPHFTCHAAGEMLRAIMAQHPNTMMTLLCGHTHGQGEVWISDNIFVKTGGARYHYPKVQEVIVVEAYE